MDSKIKCPKCGELIQITDALLEDERKTIEQEARKKISKELEEKQSLELQDLKKSLQEKDEKLEKMVKQVLDDREKMRTLETKEKERELEMQKKLDEKTKEIELTSLKKAEEDQHMKIIEKDKVILDLKKSLDEAQRKAGQGSQQTQGEAFELEFENLLKKEFANDVIQEVAKGVRGGDVIQEVIDRNGNSVGKILWELKNTKTWSEGWIDKLKSDQRTIKAEDAVIITEALPTDMKNNGAFRNGVWVTKQNSSIAIASVLRAKLIQLYYTKNSIKGKNEKTEILYSYLSGTEFKHRVEAIIEAWTSMQEDIEKEKRYFSNKWARDDKNIRQVIDNTIGMHGDLEGIMGNSLPQIKGLDVLELEEGTK